VKVATSTIPIVFSGIGDPVGTGLVDSLRRPGGNLTGLANLNTQLVGKRLELLKETVPGLTRLAVIWNPTNPGKLPEWQAAQAQSGQLGIELLSMEARTDDEPGPFWTA